MDYINYVKQSPVQGLAGMWGGTQGALQQSAGGGPEPGGNESYYGGYGFLIDGANQSFWNLSSSSNATNFGTMSTPRTDGSSTAGGTTAGESNRGIFAGGDASAASESIGYVAASGSPADASNFGDLSPSRASPAACSNGLRACIGGGAPQTNDIQYVTVASTGNSTEFGDLTQGRSGIDSISGGTRGVWAQGQSPHFDVIDYVVIATTGNATDFGDTTGGRTFGCGTNSDPGSGQNRGVFMAGYSGVNDKVDYITISTTGNATDWGELANGHGYRCGGGSNGTTGFCAGGNPGGSAMSYLTIDTAGSSSNAGTLNTSAGSATGWSGG